MRLATSALRLRLALRALNPVTIAALLLALAGLLALAWVLPAREALEAERLRARRAAALPPPVASVTPVVLESGASENLAVFRAALGRQRDVEPALKTLFGIAAKSGLVLRQGEYKRGVDRNAKLHTYQINLPVKGSYAQVWQFALQALRALPYASLDDVSFKRDNIAETGLEARLRLTLYLSDAPGAQR
ncbi:hypothetical protein [Massilia sp. Mn16-1_5]|uniref:hypothetical protein n=1 Tax=Massilia sp. Mn16-1_5 TaxID=2079199 RepID=UPI00109E52DE|nr:hypothetical protein [Massilia sp. Mn16-1_5]THC44873.1 hypothetical protein C2862_07150 [Massilia sp. Mn16-1_5]